MLLLAGAALAVAGYFGCPYCRLACVSICNVRHLDSPRLTHCVSLARKILTLNPSCSALGASSRRYANDDDEDEYEPRSRSRSSSGGGGGGGIAGDKGAIGASSAYDSHDDAAQATRCA